MREDFNKVVNAVADAMDLTFNQVVSKRRYQEVTDARWVAVFLLKEKGYYSSRIAEWMGMTTRNVNLIHSAMNSRLPNEKQLGNILEEARKYLTKMDSEL